MKYQNLAAFEKHVRGAFPDHLSHIYMVLCPDDFDRKRIMRGLSTVIQKKEGVGAPMMFDALETSVENVLGHLNSYSLFEGSSVILFDGIEKLKKSGTDALSPYLNHPAQTAFLILGAGSSKNSAEFYQSGKKELVVLDLSSEKPWDRKARLQKWVIQQAARAKKSLTPECVDFLFEAIGTQMQSLQQEVNKLICYVGDRETIEFKDAAALCTSRKVGTPWQIAQDLVWGKVASGNLESSIDPSFLFALFGQLRTHLQMGFKIAVLQKQNKMEEIWESFPNVREQTLKKYLSVAQQKGESFFSQALLILFDVELLAKNSALSAPFLSDYLIAKVAFHDR